MTGFPLCADDFVRERREVDLHFLSAAREAMLAYWTALLTSNAIVVAVFSSYSSDILIRLLIFTNLASIAILIFNFRDILEVYRYTTSDISATPEFVLRERSEKAGELNQKIRNREYFVEGLLFVQGLIIAVKFIL